MENSSKQADDDTTSSIADHVNVNAIAILRFDDRNRYGVNGIPSSILFEHANNNSNQSNNNNNNNNDDNEKNSKNNTNSSSNARPWVVNCASKKHKKSCWAKVQIVSREHKQAKLIELLGPVGDYEQELKAMQIYFHVLPCRYPKPPPSKNNAAAAAATAAGTNNNNAKNSKKKVVSKEDWYLKDIREPEKEEDCTHLHVFSVDDASTLDVDDALSLQKEVKGDLTTITTTTTTTTTYILGIHVANVARVISSTDHPLFEWAQQRGSSAYSGGVSDEGKEDGTTPSSSQKYAASSVPMLPPSLAHQFLSLVQDGTRHALSLFLTIEEQPEDAAGSQSTTKKFRIVSYRHAATRIQNRCKTTYDHWNTVTAKDDAYLVECRDLLQSLSGDIASEDLVAYTMIQYNAYFGKYLAQQGSGLLRAQPHPDTAAKYVKVASNTVNSAESTISYRHESLELDHYAHCSSPIRRFADLVNQSVILFHTKKLIMDKVNLDAYNRRCEELKRYHSTVTTMELAYSCRIKPQVFQTKVEVEEGERSLLVYTPHQGRIRVPLQDSYFASPIVRTIQNAIQQNPDATLKVELFGVLVSGRTRLRGRLIGVEETTLEAKNESISAGNRFPAPLLKPGLAPPPGLSTSSADPPGLDSLNINEKTKNVDEQIEDNGDNHEEDAEDEDEEVMIPSVELPDEIKAWFSSHTESARVDAVATELKEATVNQVLGYNIDQFQQNCLKVIVRPDLDLMAMAPTGSGKTAVALMAILQSFGRGRRAFYTSPIKALSNQKYSEFTQWFAGRGIDAHVTLLTGDVKIRAPPDAKNELIICTSEILRNKLVKASGIDKGSTSHIANAAREAASTGDPSAKQALEIMIREGYIAEGVEGDPDLDRLGCVVSDEIHYINDVERGTVWEETIMHLPADVQLVALSATLRHPETFVEWIESARGRSGKLVVRTDRHVPLHVGGLEPKSGDLLEFYGTHKDEEKKTNAGEFDPQIFHQLFNKTALEQRCSVDATRLAQKESARGARNAELQAQRDAFAGGPGKGKAAPNAGRGKGKGRGGRGGRGGNSNGRGPKLNYKHECLMLARSLDRVEKLPGIVFCMSRRMCVEGAHACSSINLLLGSKPRKKPSEDEGAFAIQQWEAEEKERQSKNRKIQKKRSQLHREHLQKFMPELGELEAYTDIMELLNCGVAYHHSGMLPILREFVELCFQQRLVRLVFATETLAVGVNMPARTVVFSQVDKPNDLGLAGGHRWLRVDEFWQMAGRAGRRGLDTVGYVVYAPTLSVAGLKNIAPVYEFNRMLTGKVAPATSQLVVDRPFVLRHLLQGHGEAILTKTLKSDEMRRENNVALEQLTQTQNSAPTEKEKSDKLLFDRYDEIEAKLSGKGGPSGLKVSISQKQQKKLSAEKRSILEKYPGGEVAFRNAKSKAGEARRVLEEIEQKESMLKSTWNQHLQWLVAAGFVKEDRITLTPRGICSAAFSNGEPLIMGTVIADGGLDNLTQKEICAWICLFIPYRGGSSTDGQPLLPEGSIVPSAAMMETVEYSDSLAMQLGLEEPLERTLMNLMLDWLTYKDLKRIAATTDAHLLGSFVKAVMRVLSYLDMMKQVLLGLGKYETHNKLDHHTDVLLGGLVTNDSLYLHMT